MTRISGLGIGGGEGRKEGARQTEGTAGAEAGRGGGCEQRVHMQPSVASAQRWDRSGRRVMWERRWERWWTHAWEGGCDGRGGGWD